MKIGVIGIGMLGEAIVLNLLNLGQDVAVYNRTKEKTMRVENNGAKVMDSPKAVAENTELVIIVVKDAIAVREISFGEKGIVESKNKAKNLFNDARQKVLDDVNKKKAALEKIIDDEINAAEQEIDQLKKSSHEKITKIAIETSSDLVKKLIGEEVNNSSISAIVEDLSKKNKEKINGI